MAERRVSVRLAAVDGDRLKAELINIGREGKQAFDSIGAASAPAGAGLNRVSDATARSLQQLEALAERATRAAASLRAAGASTGTVAERIDTLAGVSGRVQRSAADFQAYGAELDRLRAKFNPLFSTIREYRQTLAEIRQAHAVGAISADEMAQAIQRERRAALDSIAAIKGRSNAITGMARASGFQLRNLQFQLVDIAQGVPLLFQAPAAGLLNLANQGAQIAQIYGAEEGGIGRALRESAAMVGRFALRLAPIAVVAGGVAAAIAGMQAEINETSSVTVSFGDVALATWQTIADGIYNFIKPAIDAVAPWFAQAWDLVVRGTKAAGNAIVNAFNAAMIDFRLFWNNFGVIAGNAVTVAANGVIGGIEWMINRAIDLLNTLSSQANALLETIPGLPENFRVGQLAPVSIGRFENPFADQFAELMKQRDAEQAANAGRDPLGEFFNEVKQRAIANALKRTAEETKGAGNALDELKSRGEAVYRSVRTPAEEYADTMKELRGLLEANAISMEIYGRAADQAAEKLKKLQEEERKRKLEAASDPLSGAIRALEDYAAKAGDIADTVQAAFSRSFQGAEDAVGEFVSKGTVDVKSFVSSMLADLAKLSIRQAVLGPLASALGAALGGLGGGGGFLAGLFHGGGVVGQPGPARLVPAAAFAGAPRMHNGGFIGPDEVPAILKRNERVLTPEQNRQWESGRGVQVNIYARDAESFRQSRAQVAADLARAVSFGSRGM